MVYQAPILAGGLGLMFAWRKVGLMVSAKFEHEHHKTGTTFAVLQYYTPLYIGMAYMCYEAIDQAITILNMDGYFFNERADQNRVAGVQNMSTGEADAFHTETNFLYESPWMIYFSIVAIPSLIGTFIAGLIHTIAHIKQVHRKGKHLHQLPRHDRAMQIVALPIIYGLMAFKSMIRMMQVCMNDTQPEALRELPGWTERKGFLNQMYEANFSVADLYEAWALFHFASLAVDVIKQYAVEKQMPIDGCDPDGKPVIGKTLVEAIQGLTGQGIWGFIFCCVMNSTYTLVLTSGEFYGGPDTALVFRGYTEAGETAGIPAQISGAGFLASSLAIANVVQIEVAFHEWIHEMAPSSKFLSTKVLVSLAFMQSLILALPPFNAWSPTGQNMFYASLLCVECFFVSLLHVYAWPADEPWYHDDMDDPVKSVRLSSLSAPLRP